MNLVNNVSWLRIQPFTFVHVGSLIRPYVECKPSKNWNSQIIWDLKCLIDNKLLAYLVFQLSNWFVWAQVRRGGLETILRSFRVRLVVAMMHTIDDMFVIAWNRTYNILK